MAPLDPPGGTRGLTINVERIGDAAVVTLEGACTMEVSTQIQHCLVGLATEKVPAIIVDMTRLDFIDSTGLGGFVAAHLRGRHHGCTIRIVNPQPSIEEILRLTRLAQLFSIHRDLPEALAAAAKRSD